MLAMCGDPMTQLPIITIRHADPNHNPRLVYTGRIHRDFAERFGVHPDRVLDIIATDGVAITKRYIFTLAKGA